MSPFPHRGLNEDDPRNAGPIAALRPWDGSPAEVAAKLMAAAERIRSAKLRDEFRARAERVGRGEVAPPPPLFRGPGEYEAKVMALAAHPDWVSAIKAADGTLPQTCLCLFWGRPALVHPATGVVFAVAVGSVGIAARLPGKPPGGSRGDFDAARMGEGWTLLGPRLEEGWAVRAYAAAG